MGVLYDLYIAASGKKIRDEGEPVADHDLDFYESCLREVCDK